ncbi:asparagine synthase (glutamine-hydrolyzing) [Candidatus Kaiserbacteria bacterium CG10_big_fil_rev_8_21_14_0_10_59_10]|uniref:asparagine synthase (glutamine-hydrolyzing) n=1 Tax=Candidatus Kaiserbacteria bacterium CG10_big_fil_rev_8_21_14_0_10_59_10 TaxID=1974612 RepID=A0A2H0U7R2_9BACT|nr:MAG: asparagine synthase (glutamine-hydrolyzing) [Candidatus Kaiserbacteria bacterium CG10_big_fil_rev_8_21_14_0_10_59_10]
MCGIIGITGAHEGLIREAAKTFAYRGPDFSAVVSDGRVTLGHNRLSIIGLDPHANQPMANADDTLRIVFNGEIYNYKELRQELESLGHFCVTASDTEVLLHAYKAWGNAMVGRLRGMYALALYDRSAGALVLMTDYANMKPLFYAQVGSVFMFASELKGVIAMLRGVGGKIAADEEALDIYWALGYVPVPRTIFHAVRRMPRRTVLTVDVATGICTEHEYEKLSTHALTVEELQALIERKVQSHLVADVPVGLFFSGGTDSSLIASILTARNIRIEAFSLELMARPEDKAYFNAIAKHVALSIRKRYFGIKEFDEIYPTVVAQIDEPFSDSSLFPMYFLSRMAAEHVKVVLTGDGGDEYFLGYPRSLVLSRMVGAPLDAEMTILDYLYIGTPRFRGKVRLFEKLFSFFRKPLSYYLLTVSPTKDLMRPRQWRHAKRTLGSRNASPTSLDAEFYLENGILRKVDIATMYSSLEARMPLLDPEIVAAAEAGMPALLPLQSKKPLLKRMLATYLPSSLVYRGKRGFGLDAPVFFAASRYLERDYKSALAYLGEKRLIDLRRLPEATTLVRRRPSMLWQTLLLYHSLKNAGI